MSANKEVNRDVPLEDKDLERAKKFLTTLVTFFGTIKTKKKIKYTAAMAMQVKEVNPTIKQEITRFCIEWIKAFPKTSTHPAMNNSVTFCNKIKELYPEIYTINLEKIIISDE